MFNFKAPPPAPAAANQSRRAPMKTKSQIVSLQAGDPALLEGPPPCPTTLLPGATYPARPSPGPIPRRRRPRAARPTRLTRRSSSRSPPCAPSNAPPSQVSAAKVRLMCEAAEPSGSRRASPTARAGAGGKVGGAGRRSSEDLRPPCCVTRREARRARAQLPVRHLARTTRAGSLERVASTAQPSASCNPQLSPHPPPPTLSTSLPPAP